MSRRVFFLPLYVGDYLRDTMALNAEEHGAYLLLLMHAWSNAGKLTIDQDRLCRSARVDPARWPAVWSMIGRFFHEEDGLLVQRRLSAELGKAQSFREVASKRGTAGAVARWGIGINQASVEHQSSNASSINQAMLEQCLNHGISHSHSDTDQIPPKSPQRGEVVSSAFAEFWQAYPKRVGKSVAFRAWKMAAKRVGGEVSLKETCFKALAWQSQSFDWRKDNAKYVPHPATYLNQGRYLDEPQTGQGGKANPVSQSRHAVAASDLRCLFHRQAGNADRRSQEPDRNCPTCGHLSWREAPRADCNPGDSEAIVGDLFAKLGG